MAEVSFPERVKALDLPLEQIIVIASGVLDVLGIRKASDVDLAVAPELFESFADNDSWEKHEAEWGTVYYRNSDCEAWSGWELPDGTGVSYVELLPDTIEVDGIRYMSPQYVRQWKALKGRDKDLQDIALIDAYLSQQSHD